MQDLDSNIRERRFTVDQNFDGWRLDQFIADRIPRLSRSRAGEIAKFGDVEIEPARKVKAGTKLKAGDIVIVREHLAPEVVDDSSFEVIWEDESIIVINKPSGVLVHESATVRLNTVQAFLHRSGHDAAEPAHRLDRETSGVLICGKNKSTVKALRRIFADAHPRKVYRAIVLDPAQRWTEQEERIATPLGLDPTSTVRVRMGKGDLRAVTFVKRVGRVSEMSDLEIRIETGRQHQIRAHLALEGTPVAGDKLYTHDDDFFAEISNAPTDPELLSRLAFERHALHAWELSLTHPGTKKAVSFEAPLPDLWKMFT